MQLFYLFFFYLRLCFCAVLEWPTELGTGVDAGSGQDSLSPKHKKKTEAAQKTRTVATCVGEVVESRNTKNKHTERERGSGKK